MQTASTHAAVSVDDEYKTAVTDSEIEREAVRVAFHGTQAERAVYVARALYKLMRDPEDTEQVFAIGLVLNRKSEKRIQERFVAHPEGAQLMADKPAIDKEQVDFAALRALPADTLGGAYARFLEREGLDPDIFMAPPGMPPKARYVMQRGRQTHDLHHVLTGYGTDEPGELSLLSYYLGQVKAPGILLIVVAGTLRFLPQYPDLPLRIAKAVRRGRQSGFLLPTWWERRWHHPLEDVRRELGIPPL